MDLGETIPMDGIEIQVTSAGFSRNPLRRKQKSPTANSLSGFKGFLASTL
jgi:hypothetical protein